MASPLGKAKSLKFKKDGTFRIMQIADTQDTNITSKNTVEFIGKALDSETPDLVVFTGDQIKGYGLSFATGDRDKKVAEAIRNIVTPVAERKIPFTFVFGNHDDQAFGISKEKQMIVYKSFPTCLAEPGDPSISGYGNHYINILSSDGKKILFNIYLIDSLSASLDGHCSAVSEEQIAWYKSARDYLKDETGDYVPSLLFQHIPVPEMWNVLKEVPKSHKPHAVGYRSHYGNTIGWMRNILSRVTAISCLKLRLHPRKTAANLMRRRKRAMYLPCFSVMTTITALLPTIKMLFSVIHRVADLMFTVPI